MVKDRGVKVEANAKVTNITPTSVTFERDGKTMTLECDTVLNAVGFRPNNQLEDLLDEKYDEVAVIGDDNKTMNIKAKLNYQQYFSIVNSAFEEGSNIRITGIFSSTGRAKKMENASIEKLD